MTTHSPSPKLSSFTKLAYGAGDTGPAIVAAIHGFFLLNFLINVAGLNPGTAANVFLLAKIWDAINDPIFGWLTDKTNTRWGRRRPWLLFGALPFGLAFFLHWVVPPFDESGKFWYYLLIAILLDTAITAVNVPYVALTPELTQDYDERTSLNTYRFGFSILLGSVVAAFAHNLIVANFADKQLGNMVSIAIWAFVSMAGLLVTFFGTREPQHAINLEPKANAINFFKGLQIALSNKAFIYVALLYTLSWLTLQFVQNNLFIYARDWVGLPDEQFSYVLLVLQVLAFVFMVVWARISERIGKKRVYYIGAVVFMLVLVFIYFIPQNAIPLLYVAAAFASIGVAVCYLIPWSMLPDVIDADELETGERREGVFAGFFVFLQKFGLSVGLFISAWVLELTGYIKAIPGQPDPVQPDSVLFALRILVGPVGAIIIALSLVAAYFYPITKEKHAEIRAALDQRKIKG